MDSESAEYIIVDESIVELMCINDGISSILGKHISNFLVIAILSHM